MTKRENAERLVETMLVGTTNPEWWKGVPEAGIAIAIALIDAGHTDDEIQKLLRDFYYAVAGEFGA